HTSWPRDWSSDVCSSDLDALSRLPSRLTSSVAAVTWRFSASYWEIPRCVSRYVQPYGLRIEADSPGRRLASVSVLNAMPAKATNRMTMPVRSEERRVGKEGRTWWAAYQ